MDITAVKRIVELFPPRQRHFFDQLFSKKANAWFDREENRDVEKMPNEAKDDIILEAFTDTVLEYPNKRIDEVKATVKEFLEGFLATAPATVKMYSDQFREVIDKQIFAYVDRLRQPLMRNELVAFKGNDKHPPYEDSIIYTFAKSLNKFVIEHPQGDIRTMFIEDLGDQSVELPDNGETFIYADVSELKYKPRKQPATVKA